MLREFHISDAPALYELNSDPEVMRYTGDKPFSSIAEAESFVQNYDAYEKYGFGRWAGTGPGHPYTHSHYGPLAFRRIPHQVTVFLHVM